MNYIKIVILGRKRHGTLIILRILLVESLAIRLSSTTLVNFRTFAENLRKSAGVLLGSLL